MAFPVHRASTFLLLLLFLVSSATSSEAETKFIDAVLTYPNGTEYTVQSPSSVEFIRSDSSRLLIGTVLGAIQLILIRQVKPTEYVFIRLLHEISVGPGRSILGITSDPFLPGIYYVSTSSLQWRAQGFPASGWQNGKVEKLQFDERTDTIEVLGQLVEGLPVSLDTGAVYGTAVDPVSSNLFVSIATFNNGGAASSVQGDLPDCIYTSAILKVDIRKQNVSRVLEWTSDDPAVARLAQTAEESGISLYAEGIRSAFELNVFLSGDLVVVDGGANLNSGPRSISCTESVPFEVAEPDKVIRVEQGKFYGQPNRARDQCVFVSALLSDEEARQLVPEISLPLFTNAEAIENNVVVGSPTGTLEYTAAWFSSLRGTLMGAEEDPFEERGAGASAGTASYNLQTGEITRVTNVGGISLVIDAYGSMFASDFERNRITIGVPNVTRRMRKERAVRAIWPSKGLQGSKVNIVHTGSYSRTVTIGGYKAKCKRAVRQVNMMREAFSVRVLTCLVPHGRFPKSAVSVTVGKAQLDSAFIVL